MNKFFKRLFFLFRLHKSVPFAFHFYASAQVSRKKKFFYAVFVIGYALVPTDVLHDYLPLIGIIDDVAVIALVLEIMKKNAPTELTNKYKD